MNDFEIQRLVDGECSHEERAALLSSLDGGSLVWRNLAFRLLEDQSLRREFKNKASAVKSHVEIPKHREQRTLRSRFNRCMPALAASVLLISIGFWSGTYFQNHSMTPSKIAPETASRNETQPPAAYEDLIPTGRVKFTSTNSNDQTLEMPVYEVSNFNPQWIIGNDAKQLKEMNSRLLKRGWNVALDTEIYEGELPDGRRMIVPVKSVNYEPIGY